ncbi:alpha/beta hydrolase [Anatilimnocola floriformis]|uniref:alpha/beta hydrolase n=1 Tax=Anatilimnocola floriformis TaxID=2948575 RepID=UPI0020C2C903|nr:alpha/beta hydrolase [Anatilimnocola floriformis]
MFHSTTCRWVTLLLLVVAAFAGCRRPPAIIVKKRRPPVYYDTRYELLLEKDKSPLIQGAFAPFVEVLDEPVAVVRAAEQATTWEVFFATNRGLDQTTAATDQVRFGNESVATPYVGRAEIMVPRRRRGCDPAREPAAAKEARRTEDAAQFVKFDEVRDTTWAEMSAGVTRQINASRQKDLLLFVHGFNVSFESALVRTAQVALDMPFNGAVVSYSWPSQGGIFKYRDDEQTNAASVAPFTMFLQQLLTDVLPETRVNIVVHSMGNRLVLNSIARLPAATKKPIAVLALCAPDVGVSDFQKLAPAVVAQCERVTLYASTSDSALIISKSQNQEQRAGDSHPPLVVAGIETIDVSAVDFNFMGHSYYGGNVDVLSDLFRLIKQRRGPENCAYLTRDKDAGYWYFSDYSDEVAWSWHFETRR